MERKPSTVGRHGVLRLPRGFRFRPTDEELVVHYLKRRVFSLPLPAAIIPDINLAKFDPWDLPGGCEDERYLFSLKEAKYPNGSRSNRAAGSGYWKATGKDKPIKDSGLGQVVGMKKVLVFYQGKAPAGTKTDWVMHEYRLDGSDARACIFPQRKNSTHSSVFQSGDWVLCRIFKKKRATKMEVESEGGQEDLTTINGIRYIDFMGERARSQTHPPSCISDSSCVTELSDGSSSGEDNSSSRSTSIGNTGQGDA